MTPGVCLYYSACSHCGADGHPPWLSHRSVSCLHYERTTCSCGGVVRLQEYQTVSPVLFLTTFICSHTSWSAYMQSLSALTDPASRPVLPSSCANDSSAWSPLLTNSTEISVDSHMDEENNLESQVMFGHLENTLAVRCLARNEMAVVSREVKLVSNGKNTHTNHHKHSTN